MSFRTARLDTTHLHSSFNDRFCIDGDSYTSGQTATPHHFSRESRSCCGRWHLQTKQLLCVAATNLEPVGVAERRAIEPFGSDTHVFEGKINRVENAVGSDLEKNFGQSLSSKISAGRDVK